MLKQILTASAVLIAIPAVAQTSAPHTQGGQPVNQNIQPAAQANQQVPGRPATPEQLRAIIEQQFSTYDVDGSGELSQSEFTTWVSQLRAANPAGQSAADTSNWAEAAFKAADTNNSGGVDKQELAAFLARANQAR